MELHHRCILAMCVRHNPALSNPNPPTQSPQHLQGPYVQDWGISKESKAKVVSVVGIIYHASILASDTRRTRSQNEQCSLAVQYLKIYLSK